MTDSAPPVKIWYGWLQGCRRVAGGGYTEPWLPWWVVEVINDKWYQIIIILPAGDLFPPLRYFSSHNYSWLRLGRGGARRRYGSLIESEISIYFLFSQMSGNLTHSRVCSVGSLMFFSFLPLLMKICHQTCQKQAVYRLGELGFAYFYDYSRSLLGQFSIGVLCSALHTIMRRSSKNYLCPN